MQLEYDTIPGFTQAECEDVIRNAVLALEVVAVPAEFRELAFSAALQMLSQKQVVPKIPEALRGIIPVN